MRRKSKYRLMMLFMGILGLALTGRLLMLTVIQEDKWSAYADDMTNRVVYETAPRGDITDRNGRLLATSRCVYSVHISKVALEKDTAMESAFHVINILKERREKALISVKEVRERMESTGYDSYLPLVMAEDISREAAEDIAQQEYPGVQISEGYVREYPQGALASHVIGYMGRISEGEQEEYVEGKGYRRDAVIGKSGIEEAYEEALKGEDAVSILQVDSLGKVTKLLGETEAVKGQDVRLTIDIELQRTAEAALEQAIEQAACGGVFQSEYGDYSMVYAEKAAVGAAVALDVKKGEVLAMASVPDFDPNDFAEGISTEKWEALQRKNENDPLSPSPMYNVAALTAVQPGSTFKPVTALAALSCGLDQEQRLYDDGTVKLGGISYGCHLWNSGRSVHGYVDLADAIKTSCNYYFYDIASGMDLASGMSLGYEKAITNDTITKFAAELGLGKETGIEIRESAGVLPSQTLKKASLKTGLTNYLLAEQETYFKRDLLKNREKTRRYIEKIVNWADKDLTFDEIIGKLKKKNYVKTDQVEKLANICKYTWFDQMGWTLGDTFNISIGQGDNAYTPLQMASYIATLGNGGVRNQVTLIAGENDKANEDKREGQSSENRQSDSKVGGADIACVLETMKGVTAEPEGSLYTAFSSFPYSVAGKTGTAQRTGKIPEADEKDYIRRHLHLILPQVSLRQVETEADRLMELYPDVYDSEITALRRAMIQLGENNITYEDIDRYKEDYDNFAWTVALAPAEDPQIAVAVMLVQGKTASNAAPVVREIIGKYGEISKWEKSF